MPIIHGQLSWLLALWPRGSLQLCCYGRSIIKSKVTLMKVVVPFVFVEWALLTKLPVLRPSVLVFLSKMTLLLRCVVNLLLKISQPKHFLLFCTCWWIASKSLISWSSCSSWRVGLVAFLFWLLASHKESASWFVSSGCKAAPSTVALFGGMSKVNACRRLWKWIHRRWAPMLVTCSQMLWIKNKTTQLFIVRDIRLPKHYFPMGIILIRRRSRRTYLHHLISKHEIQRNKHDNNILIIHLFLYSVKHIKISTMLIL
jgi:hypothetical protein